MKLLVLSTLGAATILFAAMMGAGCTVTTTDTPDGSAPAVTPDAGQTPTDAGTDSGDSGACLKDEGRGPFCHADNTAEVPAKCGNQCDTASSLFKSDLARSIVDCMDEELAKNYANDAGTDDCEAAAKNCVPQAVLLACTDDVSSLCDGYVAKCAGDTFTKDQCVQYMQGATKAGRDLFNTCLTENASQPSKELCSDCLESLQSLRGE
jgi:hypothetical protein